MEKELVININNYILLEVLNMLDYLGYDKSINDNLNQLKKIVSKKIFGTFFDNLDNLEIIDVQFIIKYKLEDLTWVFLVQFDCHIAPWNNGALKRRVYAEKGYWQENALYNGVSKANKYHFFALAA